MASSPEVMPQGPQGPPQPQPIIQNGPQPAQPQQFRPQPQRQQPPTGRNPCCFQLRMGVLTVAILQLIFTPGVGLWALVGIVLTSHDIHGKDPITSKPLTLHICFFLSSIFGFVIALVLLFGAIKKSLTLVKIGFIGNIIFYLSLIGESVWEAYFERGALDIAFNIFCIIGGITLGIYLLYVIYAYIKELVHTEKQKQGVVQMGGYGQSSVTPSQQSYPQASASNVGSASNMGSPQPGTP